MLGGAQAQIVALDPFVGRQFEGWEGWQHADPDDCHDFGTIGSFCADLIWTDGGTSSPECTLMPYEGDVYLDASSTVWAEFEPGIRRFGGYFGNPPHVGTDLPRAR